MELGFLGLAVVVAAISAVVSVLTTWAVVRHQIAETNKSLQQEIIMYQRLAKRETLIRTMEIMIASYRDFTEYSGSVVGKGDYRAGAIARFNALVRSIELGNPNNNEKMRQLEATHDNFTDNLTQAVNLITAELENLTK